MTPVDETLAPTNTTCLYGHFGPGWTPSRPAAPKRSRLTDGEGQALLKRLSEEDSQALSLLISAYSPMVFGVFLRWFRVSLEDAEDLHQEVFLQMLIQSKTIANVRPWLLGTAINQARKRVRKLVRDRNLTETYSRQFQPQVPPDTGDDRDLVSRIFSKARPADRKLLQLIYFEGLDYHQTAERLGRPIGSIGPMRGRALARCADIIKGLGRRTLHPSKRSQSLSEASPCPARWPGSIDAHGALTASSTGGGVHGPVRQPVSEDQAQDRLLRTGPRRQDDIA